MNGGCRGSSMMRRCVRRGNWGVGCDEILDLFGCVLYYKISTIYIQSFMEAYMIIFLTEELVHNCLSRHVFNQFKALGLLPQTPGGCAASGGN